MPIAALRAGACGMAPRAVLMQAPPHWRCVDFISDLHLQASDIATFDAWQQFMQGTRAQAVFILGDLFDVWIGDDVIDGCTRLDGAAELSHGQSFEAACAQVLAAAARRLEVFFMPGNRDFLIGQQFASACGMTLLHDPCSLDFAGRRWLLSHGDALCLQDTAYQRFRAQVRCSEWQQNFLGQALLQRQKVAQALRKESQTYQSEGMANGRALADLDPGATCQWLEAAAATTLIHGHTHRPTDHDLPNGLRRIVLSDWDALAAPPRAQVLRLNATTRGHTTGCRVQRLAAKDTQ